MEEKRLIRAAAAQWDIRLGDISHNMKKAESFLEDFSNKGVRLSVLPEMWSCGFDYRNLSTHAQETPAIIERLERISEKKGMIICGSLPEKRDGEILNTLYVMDGKGSKCSYSKIHLFTPTGEDRHFSSGGRAVVCEAGGIKIGLIICYDLRFPELCRALALEGAEIIICSAQWPETRINHWNTLLSARAIENQLFVVASNRIGNDFSLVYGGSSRIISPLGNIMDSCGSEEGYSISDIDLEEMLKFRAMMPCLEHIRLDAYRSIR